ncbi:hypothetical protein MLD38_030726 [Melastoma candidum]|uniref:Uncharacterized protein n=1 Tax=Melastoma candidum TaxID=119954 RepID=A0ACB9MPM5_9MYRT|nr:hypothetical protein MLD38_030726 [Melastoma candidum]
MCKEYNAVYIDRVKARGGAAFTHEHICQVEEDKGVLALYLADAMQILKKGKLRAQSWSPRDEETEQMQRKAGLSKELHLHACHYQGSSHSG